MSMLKKLTNEQGFTLLELLLSVAIISLLAGLSLPVYRTLLSKNDLDIATQVSANSLRRAEVLSQSTDGDITWGVKAQSGSIVIFKGASYATRDTTFDETFNVPTNITFGGMTEILFAKFTGLPQTTGTLSLSSETDSRAVTINSKGMVNY